MWVQMAETAQVRPSTVETADRSAAHVADHALAFGGGPVRLVEGVQLGAHPPLGGCRAHGEVGLHSL